MVSRIYLLCAFDQGLHNLGIPVAKIEYTAVAVHVDETVPVQILKYRALALSHCHFDAKASENIHLVRVPDLRCFFINFMCLAAHLLPPVLPLYIT